MNRAMTANLVSIAEMEELRERNRQLEKALTGLEETGLAMRLGLTPSEFAIYRVLKTHRIASREALMLALYSDRADDPPDPRTIDVLVCKLRRKLLPHDLSIVSQWGTGWRLLSSNGTDA